VRVGWSLCWLVRYVLGRVVFVGFIPKYGVDAGMVVCTVLLYVVCSLCPCAVFISLHVTNALPVILITRRVCSGHLTAIGTNAPHLISVAAI